MSPSISRYTRVEQAIARGLAPERISDQEKIPVTVVFEVMDYLDAVNSEPEGSLNSYLAFHRQMYRLERRENAHLLS